MASQNFTQDSRLLRLALRARLVTLDGGKIALHAPAVGLWRGRPPAGTLVRAETPLGHLEILGVLHELIAPPGAEGVITATAQGDADPPARCPVAWDDLLMVLEPQAATEALAVAAEVSSRAPGHGQVLRAPTSGRFYRRPAPDKPAFLEEGAVIREGQVVGLLEVMKTFTRIHYGGADLPSPARVTRVLVREDADIATGEALFEVEAAEG